jgi:regulator of RNase E activity RraA
VFPDDVVVIDADGAVVIPRALVQPVADMAVEPLGKLDYERSGSIHQILRIAPVMKQVGDNFQECGNPSLSTTCAAKLKVGR